MVEEQVIQPESVTPAEQPVAETPAPKAPNLDSVKLNMKVKFLLWRQKSLKKAKSSKASKPN